VQGRRRTEITIRVAVLVVLGSIVTVLGAWAAWLVLSE